MQQNFWQKIDLIQRRSASARTATAGSTWWRRFAESKFSRKKNVLVLFFSRKKMFTFLFRAYHNVSAMSRFMKGTPAPLSPSVWEPVFCNTFFSVFFAQFFLKFFHTFFPSLRPASVFFARKSIQSLLTHFFTLFFLLNGRRGFLGATFSECSEWKDPAGGQLYRTGPHWFETRTPFLKNWRRGKKINYLFFAKSKSKFYE
jgi:hypothetical protein